MLSFSSTYIRSAIEIADVTTSCIKGLSRRCGFIPTSPLGSSMRQTLVPTFRMAWLCTFPRAPNPGALRPKIIMVMSTTVLTRAITRFGLTDFIPSLPDDRRFSYEPASSDSRFFVGRDHDQKLNVICKSMLRFEAGEEKNPPASALDLSKSGDSSTPTGCARLTLLKTFRVMAAKVSE